MAEITYEELEKQINQCYAGKNYQQAYELATQNKPKFQNEAMLLDYYRMCSAARMGSPEITLQVLAQALEAGSWYSEFLLTQSPSLTTLLELPEYQALVSASAQMAAEETSNPKTPKIVEPSGAAKPYPLLVALHSNAASVETDHIFWHTLLPEGWLLAFPESPIAMYKGAYMWDDRQAIVPAVVKAYETACRDYPVDRSRVIVAGHSMGAQQAAWMALNQTIPNIGFITMGLYLPEDEAKTWEPLVEQRAGSGLRGVMFYGELDDSIPHDNLLALAERMNAHHLPVMVKSFPGLGHDFAPEVQQALPGAVRFLLPE